MNFTNKFFFPNFQICVSNAAHTTYNSIYKWTKLLTLEMTIFGLKMMVRSGLEFFILKLNEPLQSCCCPVQKNRPRKAELAWQVSKYSLKGLIQFQNKKL